MWSCWQCGQRWCALWFACTWRNGGDGGASALWTVVTVSDRCAFDLPPFRRCVEDFSWSPFLPTVLEVSLVRKLVAVIVCGLLLYQEMNFSSVPHFSATATEWQHIFADLYLSHSSQTTFPLACWITKYGLAPLSFLKTNELSLSDGAGDMAASVASHFDT